MHSIVLEKPWESLAQPIKQLSLTELRKLKNQYKHLKEVKSRHITDIQGVLGVYGYLAPTADQVVSDSSEQQRESVIPMDVKFEEEPYEEDDWFLMLLSELIFNK